MNRGKVSDSVLKRSVLKLIKKRNPQVQKPAIGMDCAVITQENEKRIVSAVSCGSWPVFRVANNIAACGGTPVAVQCCILLPEEAQESELKDIMKSLDGACEKLGMQISGGHTQVSGSVSSPIVTVTGIGLCHNKELVCATNIKPNQDVIMTKWIGIGGIRKLIETKQSDIQRVYSQEVIDKAAGNQEDMSVVPEAQLVLQAGVTAMHDVAEGGIYAALWDMAEAGHVGLEIDFRKIAVKQEVIELCELFDVNPYELESTGCLLMTSERGYDIVKLLMGAGIKAQVIGRTTEGNDRVIRNLDEARYLETPKSDELYRFIEG